MPMAPAPMTPTFIAILGGGIPGRQHGVRLAVAQRRRLVVDDERELGAASAQLHRSVAVTHDGAGRAGGNLVERDPLGAGQQDTRLALGEPHDEPLPVELARERGLGELFLALLLDGVFTGRE